MVKASQLVAAVGAVVVVAGCKAAVVAVVTLVVCLLHPFVSAIPQPFVGPLLLVAFAAHPTWLDASSQHHRLVAVVG